MAIEYGEVVFYQFRNKIIIKNGLGLRKSNRYRVRMVKYNNNNNNNELYGLLLI
jgi:hypothetical protein